MNTKQHGFTLIEMMITITILGILLAIAAPSFNRQIQQQRLKAAAESLASDLLFARNEAIRTNEATFFTLKVEADSSWSQSVCALNGAPTCDCNSATSLNPDPAATPKECKLLFTKSSTWPNVTITDSSKFDLAFKFDPKNGMPRDTDDSKWADSGKKYLEFSNSSNALIYLGIGSSGRIKLCTSNDANKSVSDLVKVENMEACL
jgi:type IV fimbrial biogenesis protein FimT